MLVNNISCEDVVDTMMLYLIVAIIVIVILFLVIIIDKKPRFSDKNKYGRRGAIYRDQNKRL